MTSKTETLIDKIILALNLVTYRSDAFFANTTEGVFILSYKLVLTHFITKLDINCSSLFSILLVSSLLHAQYIIVYIINDLIDFTNSSGNKPNLNSSFYKLRPIYCFHRSKVVIIYAFALYITYMALILLCFNDLFYSSIIFIALTIPLSITHSFHGTSIRVVTFYLLRIVKYGYAVVVYDILTHNQLYDEATIIVILSLVIPYVTYSSVNYCKQLIGSCTSMVIRKILIITTLIIASLFILVRSTIVRYQLLELAKSTITGYLLIVLPIICVREALRELIGETNLTYYHHLARVIMGTILTVLIVSTIYCFLIVTK